MSINSLLQKYFPICYNELYFTENGVLFMERIGFIGVGNMGGALARVASQITGAEHITVSSRTTEKAAAFAAELGCRAADNKTLAAQAQMIFLGVKPQKMAELLRELSPVLAKREDRFVLVTMAAGLSTEQIAQMVGLPCPVLRIMPNTPCLVGAGLIPYCGNDLATQEDFCRLEEILSAAGKVTPLPESLIDAAGALCGCGPAFVYLYAEALADGAVACGLPRATAMEYAARTLIGAGEMLLQTGKHPSLLKDEVCSPAGSTIEGVMTLEQHGLRSGAQAAVLAAYRRNLALGS